MQTSESPVVTVIGSCRVFTPVNLVADECGFTVGHKGIEWFTHSTQDAIQKVDIVQQRLAVTETYIPLIVNELTKWTPDSHSPSRLASTSVFVVEICSLQILSLNEYVLQQWCVRDSTGDAKDLAMTATKTVQNAEDVERGILELHDKIERRPLLIVTHNSLTRDDGKVPPTRVILKKGCELAAKARENIRVFDPTAAILEFGRSAAMKDIGHYLPEFEPVLGRQILASARELLDRSL